MSKDTAGKACYTYASSCAGGTAALKSKPAAQSSFVSASRSFKTKKHNFFHS